MEFINKIKKYMVLKIIKSVIKSIDYYEKYIGIGDLYKDIMISKFNVLRIHLNYQEYKSDFKDGMNFYIKPFQETLNDNSEFLSKTILANITFEIEMLISEMENINDFKYYRKLLNDLYNIEEPSIIPKQLSCVGLECIYYNKRDSENGYDEKHLNKCEKYLKSIDHNYILIKNSEYYKEYSEEIMKLDIEGIKDTYSKIYELKKKYHNCYKTFFKIYNGYCSCKKFILK